MDSTKIIRKGKEIEIRQCDIIKIKHKNGRIIEGRIDGIREDRITLDCSRRYMSNILHLDYEDIKKVLFVNGDPQ